MDADLDLKVFLESAGLPHLINNMLEEEMTLEVLLQANETELGQLTTKVVDKIKLRSALESLRKQKCTLLDCEAKELSSSGYLPVIPNPGPVALPERQNTIIIPQREENENCSFQELSYLLEDDYDILGDLSLNYQESSPVNCKENSLTNYQETSLENCEENSHGSSQKNSDEKGAAENLYHLLINETTGKRLLEKAEKGQHLSPRDRAYIVKVVVEAELRTLNKINHTIRRDVWQRWADEITELFKGESKNLYYVPYHVVEGKVIQASGLIHYRLITHRRSLAPESSNRKDSNSNNSDSGCSSKSSHSESNIKRVRPLPDGFKVNRKNLSSLEEQLDWLRGSSSPYDTVLAKWQATFELRTKFLESHSYLDYFKTFPALQLPNGYQLLSNDFEGVYPSANKTFVEKFPLIKLKLLKLLTERGESSRVNQPTLELLELASVGEEQANVAAFLGIVCLLRQMPTICIPRKKVWKLTKEEAKNGFLARVATASEIETYCIQREIFCSTKGIPNQPFILAIGPSWSDVLQYEVVINKGVRYQLSNVCSAVMHTFNIYWALDCAYPRESAPCWMLIQRAIFQITSKFDTEGVPLRELLLQLDVTHNVII